MNWRRAYRALLRLYPSDYQELFAKEMLSTFEQAAWEMRQQAGPALIKFLLAELIGLLCGAGAEWVIRMTGGSSVRSRLHAARGEIAFAGTDVGLTAVPSEITEAQERIAVLIHRMVLAIANHDFPGARRYSDEERQARIELRRLREKYHIDDSGNGGCS